MKLRLVVLILVLATASSGYAAEESAQDQAGILKDFSMRFEKNKQLSGALLKTDDIEDFCKKGYELNQELIELSKLHKAYFDAMNLNPQSLHDKTHEWKVRNFWRITQATAGGKGPSAYKEFTGAYNDYCVGRKFPVDGVKAALKKILSLMVIK